MLKKILENDVKMLSHQIGARSSHHLPKLNQAKEYIIERIAGAEIVFKPHSYKIHDGEVSNLVYERPGKINKQKEGIILMGAHYDTVDCTPGADDNASSVAVLISLIRMLSSYENQHTFRFVFFTLEEPPHFREATMGSIQYARYMKEQGETINLMVALDMVGFYSEENIQEFPNSALKAMFPEQGNFVAIVSLEQYRKIVKNFSEPLAKHSYPLSVQPPFYTETEKNIIHLSDHASFFDLGPALMITDTAIYRNQNYHQPGDTYDTLDYAKMALLTQGLYKALQDFDRTIDDAKNREVI